MDMRVPSYLVASAVRLIMAQRIVRKICSSCKEEVEVSLNTIKMLGLTEEEGEKIKFYKGRGCSDCNSTGFSGRIGLFEVMPIIPDIEKLILSGSSSVVIKEAAFAAGMLTLRDAGIEKLKAGITTVDEVIAETSL
jgi:type IV pilus assembly protein PilB